MESPARNEIHNESVLLGALAELAADNADIAVLWLYGSRATGHATVISDIDLAIAFERHDESAWEHRLRPETLALEWAHSLELPSSQLSIVDINTAPIHLALNIIKADRVLYVKDPSRLAREENRISSIWEIDHLYHQRQAE